MSLSRDEREVRSLVSDFEDYANDALAAIEMIVTPGRKISWVTRRGDKKYRQYGTVVQTGWHRYLEEVLVENEKTGKRTRISFGDYWETNLL